MTVRAWLTATVTFCVLILTFYSASGAEQLRGIKIVAEDSNSKQWVDIPLYNKTCAIVIGIDRYPALKQDRQLSYAVSDARAVENMLKSKFVFDDVFTLYNEQATKNNILDLLVNKLARISDNDAVFVFFAGHGGEEKTNFGTIGFLVPYDGDFSDMRKVISMTAIRDDISKRIKAKHVFFVVDACYSGILVATRGEQEKTSRDLAYLQQIAKEPVRQVLTAGSGDQQVLDGGPGGHSVFTGRFLEILDKSDDFITANEISSLVTERVFSDANARGHVQTPTAGKLFGLGDFIFMPSVTKQIGSIKDQVTTLESELASLKNAEAKAAQNHDEAARREAERQTQVAEAKLQAKRLEAERLKTEELQRVKRETEQREAQDALRREQEAEAQRLAKLQTEVTEKRKLYKTSMVNSLEEALKELQALDQEIRTIRDRYREELKNRVWAIAREYSANIGVVKLKKDEFETEAEYKARLAKNGVGAAGDNKPKYQAAINTIRAEYEKQIAPLQTQMEEIAKLPYTVYGHDGLKLALGPYDAERQFFSITIASTNIQRPIYPYQHLYIVSKVEGQARKVGIGEGDIVLRYNGQDVTPLTDWDRLKQTVITDTTTIEIDRDGQIIPFVVGKGKLGTHWRIDDYLAELSPDQFMVNGNLYVPRAEARQFKQDFLNGFVTAEVKVLAKTAKMSLVVNAQVVDESNDKRYDLFKSEYLNLGNRLTYDNQNQIYWIGKGLHNLGFQGAKKFLAELEYQGTLGWELPTFEHLKSIRNPLATWKFPFYGSTCYTSTLTSDSSRHYPYRPSDEKSTYGNDDSPYLVIGINDNLRRPKYEIFADRYLAMDDDLIFDAESTLVWLLKSSPKELTYLEAGLYLKELQENGLKGWRLPSRDELKKWRDPAFPGVDPRYRDKLNRHFYTSTLASDSSRHYPYRPSDEKTVYGDDNRSYSVIAVM